MKKDSRKRNNIRLGKIILLFLVVFGFISCNKSQKDESCGFILQEFEVTDPQLKRLIWSVRDSLVLNKKIEDNHVLIMELKKNDSIFEVGFVKAEKSRISEMYIFKETRRIVGYLKMGEDIIIVLSHIPSHLTFGMNMYKFIIPTGNKQRFDYIYFPDDLYGPESRGFPPPPLLFSPHYSWYTYQNGEYIYQEGFTTGKRIGLYE